MREFRKYCNVMGGRLEKPMINQWIDRKGIKAGSGQAREGEKGANRHKRPDQRHRTRTKKKNMRREAEGGDGRKNAKKNATLTKRY